MIINGLLIKSGSCAINPTCGLFILKLSFLLNLKQKISQQYTYKS